VLVKVLYLSSVNSSAWASFAKAQRGAGVLRSGLRPAAANGRCLRTWQLTLVEACLMLPTPAHGLLAISILLCGVHRGSC